MHSYSAYSVLALYNANVRTRLSYRSSSLMLSSLFEIFIMKKIHDFYFRLRPHVIKHVKIHDGAANRRNGSTVATNVPGMILYYDYYDLHNNSEYAPSIWGIIERKIVRLITSFPELSVSLMVSDKGVQALSFGGSKISKFKIHWGGGDHPFTPLIINTISSSLNYDYS